MDNKRLPTVTTIRKTETIPGSRPMPDVPPATSIAPRRPTKMVAAAFFPLKSGYVNLLANQVPRIVCLQLLHHRSVELVRSSNECIGDFESTEEGFTCPDFRVTTWALCIDHRSIAPPFAKLIPR